MSSLKNSLSRKKKHWSQRVRETIISRSSSDGEFHITVEGGAENGQFVFVGNIKQDKLHYKQGKLHSDDIFLEINDTPVAGYTLHDITALVKQTGEILTLRTVKPGSGITKDLRQFLSTRFQKSSVDHDLQQTIRDNLYQRTIPCTTREPRNDEIPGVDYNFLSEKEFDVLEKSGALLESGLYDANRYGTPKPPKEPQKLTHMPFPHLEHKETNKTFTQSKPDTPNFNTPTQYDSSFKYDSIDARKRDSIDSRSRELKSNGDLHNDFDYDKKGREQGQGVHDSAEELGPLPPSWEIAYTENNEKYFIDHNSGTTHWIDPRLVQKKKLHPEECEEDELPYGWEKVDDPKYGVYYIDHINRKTQFENPVIAKKPKSTSSFQSPQPPPHQSPPTIRSAAALAKAQEAEASARWPGLEFSPQSHSTMQRDVNPRRPIVTDPENIRGDYVHTVLHKKPTGFGFTIVGGDQPGELLQIKSVVPHGAASVDGKVKPGDALLRINGMSVATHTHQDVVGMFQNMPVGEEVELELIRGHPLPFDPDDPNVETVGAYTVVRAKPGGGYRAESPVPSNASMSTNSFNVHHSSNQSLASSNASTQHASSIVQPITKQTANQQAAPPSSNLSGHGYPLSSERYSSQSQFSTLPHKSSVNQSYSGEKRNSLQERPAFSQSVFSPDPNDTLVTNKAFTTSTFPRTSTTMSLPRSEAEILTIPIVKGPMGFGFTIADSPYGQKVKQILDEPRCNKLREGDILVDINGHNIRSCTHKEAVNILKNCPKERESIIIVQRGGIPIRSSPGSIRGSTSTQPRALMPESKKQSERPKSTPPINYTPTATDSAPRMRSTNSLGNVATEGESTRNQETESEGRPEQPLVNNKSDALLLSYPSLRRAVHNAAWRKSQENINVPIPPDNVSIVSEEGLELSVMLKRGGAGFGFRIVGGAEEDTQVAIGTIVRGGAAHMDGRLKKGDEIVSIDGIDVIDAAHRRVISLMGNAAHKGQVTLGIRRRRRSGRTTPGGTMRRSMSTSSQLSNMSQASSQASKATSISVGNLTDFSRDDAGSVRSYSSTSRPRDRHRSEGDLMLNMQNVNYKDITLHREDYESFGFVILSTSHKSGSTIGRIVQGSPADRSNQLHVGDKLIAVNGRSIVGMHHSNIVNTIKQSGLDVTLSIAQKPVDDGGDTPARIPHLSASEIGRVRRDSEDSTSLREREIARKQEDLLQKHKEELKQQQKELLDRQRGEMRRQEQEEERRRLENERLRKEQEDRRQVQYEEERRRFDEEEKRRFNEEEKRRFNEEEKRRSNEEEKQRQAIRENEERQHKLEEERRRQQHFEEERRRIEDNDKRRRLEDEIRQKQIEQQIRNEAKKRMEEERRRRDELDLEREHKEFLEDQKRQKKSVDARRWQQFMDEKYHGEDVVDDSGASKRVPPPTAPKPKLSSQQKEKIVLQKAPIQDLQEEKRYIRPEPNDSHLHPYVNNREGQSLVGPSPQNPRRTPSPHSNLQFTNEQEFNRSLVQQERDFSYHAEKSRSKSYSEDMSLPPREQTVRTGGTLVREKSGTVSQFVTVQLDRGNQGYGFSLRGGRELGMNIFILRIAEGGVADRDGRLKVGDEIIEINGISTHNMLHSDAINAIKSSGAGVKLLLRRASRSPAQEGVPNGGQVLSNHLPKDIPQERQRQSYPYSKPPTYA